MMRATEIAHLIALQMLHADMADQPRQVHEILDEAEREHGHTIAMMARNEFQRHSRLCGLGGHRAAALRELIEKNGR